jgi:hypothetical protein
MFSVNLWGSDPEEENDDCHTGEDFATLEEAEACFQNPWDTFSKSYYRGCTHTIELDGPEVYKTRLNASFKPSEDNDSAWQREQAMQAGMGFGVEAYNEIMGYD